jgi:hypothetical protein
MALKLVLISASGTLMKDNVLYQPLIADLCGVIARLNKSGVRTAVWSNRRWLVNERTPLQDYLSAKAGCLVECVGAGTHGFPARRRSDSVAPVLQHFAVARHETILVGNSEEDLMAGVNNKLLLVRPDWYPSGSEYGFSVKSIAELERFCTIFGLRQHPIYWSIDDQGLRAFAMGPYSTKIQTYAGFGVDAFRAAKYEQGSLEFWHRLVVSSLYFSSLISQVDYIASYPGHSADPKVRAVDEVMTSLGKCFRQTFFPDLIMRHMPAIKSAFAGAADKTFANQINTIRLNSYPHPYGGSDARKSAISLKGKTVLVVDDICTNGRSLESARVYIEAAGGQALLFAWLKTINTSFLRMVAAPTLKPFKANALVAEPATQPYGYAAGIVDPSAPTEIATLLDAYKAWIV